MSLQPLFNILLSFHARGFVLVGKKIITYLFTLDIRIFYKRLRTDSVDKVKVDVERDKWDWKQSEEQLQDAGNRVDVATLVGKRPHSITIYQRTTAFIATIQKSTSYT